VVPACPFPALPTEEPTLPKGTVAQAQDRILRVKDGPLARRCDQREASGISLPITTAPVIGAIADHLSRVRQIGRV